MLLRPLAYPNADPLVTVWQDMRAGGNLNPLHERVVGDARPALLALSGAVALVLLIACANIANLLLSRASVRRRELAVRMALGAGVGRVIRQLLTESVILALAGGAAGVLLGLWALDALVSIAPQDTPRLREIGLDWAVLAFAGILTIATGVLFGLAPVLETFRRESGHALKDDGRTGAGAGGRTLRRGLIAVEVALALVLLTGARCSSDHGASAEGGSRVQSAERPCSHRLSPANDI